MASRLGSDEQNNFNIPSQGWPSFGLSGCGAGSPFCGPRGAPGTILCAVLHSTSTLQCQAPREPSRWTSRDGQDEFERHSLGCAQPPV
ncbi:hypothetical protein BKA80DRAFT_303794 [Phyllosticta citrichinensis]